MNFRSRTAALLYLPSLIISLTVTGCGYGPISETGYQYAKALYSLSNRQSADRIDAVVEQINAAEESGELPAKEAEWLRDICTQCHNGDWDSAQANARRMMADQVKH